MPEVAWLRDRFFIDPAGVLRHNKTLGKSKLGEPVGRVQKGGYYWVDVMHEGKRKKLAVHRIVWSMKNGMAVPDELQVDHRNRDRGHNAPRNLKAATPRENMLNRCCAGKGATKAGSKWRSKISVHGKTIHLGTFDRKVDAVKAYKLALKGLHPRCTVEILAGGSLGGSKPARSLEAADARVSLRCKRVGHEANLQLDEARAAA